MPITRKQFEWGVDAEIEKWMNKILAFLAEHKNEAFTRDELWKLIYKQTSWPKPVREAFNEALDKLVVIKEAERRIIRDVEYYIYAEEEPPF